MTVDDLPDDAAALSSNADVRHSPLDICCWWMNYVITYKDEEGTEFKTTVFALDPRQAIRLFHKKVPEGIVTKAIPEPLIDL